jgi:hypothetical protein
MDMVQLYVLNLKIFEGIRAARAMLYFEPFLRKTREKPAAVENAIQI